MAGWVASYNQRLRTDAAEYSLLPATRGAIAQRRISRVLESLRSVTLLPCPPQVDDQSMCADGQDHHAPMPWNCVVYWWCKESEEDVPHDGGENDEEVYQAVMDEPVYDRSMESLLNILEVFAYYHDKKRNLENEEGAVNCRL